MTVAPAPVAKAIAELQSQMASNVTTFAQYGALAALIFTDAIVRLVPGVLGDDQSAVQESFSTGLLDHPQYTRPENFNGWSVPEALLSGNHGAIASWRKARARELTERRRPDLLPASPPP